MNGTMEEPMDTTESNTTETTPAGTITNDCDENSTAQNSMISEDSNHVDQVDEISTGGVEESSNAYFSANEDSRNVSDQEETSVPNNIAYGNQFSNSNDSTFDQNSADLRNTNNLRPNRTLMSEDEDSGDITTDEDGTVGSDEPRAEDTVSINSDSDPGEELNNTGEIKNDPVLLQNIDRNGDNANGTQSSDTHDNESENEDKKEEEPSLTEPTRRRSARNIKRKSYEAMENGEESEMEEVAAQDPLAGQSKSKAVVVNDTKTIVEMAAQQIKTGIQKKEPTVVIIDTNSIISGKVPVSLTQPKQITPQMSAQSLYQSIAARGTTVTPVSIKQAPAVHTQTPVILPSLTDDMYVVEAPSFIVPYVYEKPSLKPFREYVDILGKELEEKRQKDEEERLAKKEEEREQRNKERRERGEESEKEEESEQEEAEKEDEKVAVAEVPVAEAKKDKKNRKRGKTEEDDASWDESSGDSEEEAISDDDTGTTVVIKDKADDSLDNLKPGLVPDIIDSKPLGVKSDNYFDNALGKFFINIGVNLVQEFVQNDLLKQQKRKLHKEIKIEGANVKPIESAIISLTKNLEFSKENNAPYAFQQKKCKYCSFKTESALVLEHHLETPHMKNNVYKCNFCEFEIKSPHDILYHMEEKHNTRGRLERAPAYHQCANCPFEDNGKGKLARHLIPCAKKFKPELNLAPPIEWEPPAKIPKIPRSRNSMMNNYPTSFSRSQVGIGLPNRQPINIAPMIPQNINTYRARSRSPMGVTPRGAPPHGAPLIRGNVMMRHNNPSPLMTNYPIMPPSISITPLPRASQPPQSSPQSKGTFVICEICDGYIKDLEQLRNHMQWIHKVKIHPKMIYNRPPLNCQKCQFRFFTDQGLERHLLGSHGLVTSSMQEAANKGKDAGRCPVCGRVYQWKLLNHVAKDHNLTLKPAHLSYKCTVCTATFGMYKQFENHVYSAHSVVAKRVMEKSKPPPTPAAAKAPEVQKPVKINDEITIIPQSARPQATVIKGKDD